MLLLEFQRNMIFYFYFSFYRHVQPLARPPTPTCLALTASRFDNFALNIKKTHVYYIAYRSKQLYGRGWHEELYSWTPPLKKKK